MMLNNKICNNNKYKLSMLGKIFVTISFFFIFVLFLVTVYEVSTGNLPTDSRDKLEDLDKKYGDFGFNSWLQNVNAEDDNNIPFTKLPDFEGKTDNRSSYQQEKPYNFVICFNEVSKLNITYPEGTKCDGIPEDYHDLDERDGIRVTNDLEKKAMKEDDD